MKKSNFKTKSGFTIIETLVAVTILIVGVLGPLALAARGISDGLFAQNQLTANVLAQEAIETMVNQRNANIVTPNTPPFFKIADNLAINGSIGTVSVDGADGTINLTGCVATGCKLVIELTDLNDPNSGIYRNDTSSNPTGLFNRKITVTKISDGEVRVDVVISWKNKTVDKYLATTIYLYGA